MTGSLVLEIAEAITPAPADIREQARRLLGVRADRPVDSLSALAARLSAARHTLTPSVRNKYVVICVGDHGVAGSNTFQSDATRPSQAALEEIASGRAAVNSVARSAAASLIIVDCGVVREPDADSLAPVSWPSGLMDLRIGNGTADIREGPAMTREQAEASVHTGMALALSLADADADCLALGQVAPGAQVVSEALCASLLALPTRLWDAGNRAVVAEILRVHGLEQGVPADPLDVLAALGGYEIGVLTGVILAAASVHIPVVLDGCGTSAAALLAASLSAHVPDYLIASHAGHSLGHQQALHDLRLPLLFDLGVSHGEGAGAAMALPILDTAAHLLDRAHRK